MVLKCWNYGAKFKNKKFIKYLSWYYWDPDKVHTTKHENNVCLSVIHVSRGWGQNCSNQKGISQVLWPTVMIGSSF